MFTKKPEKDGSHMDAGRGLMAPPRPAGGPPVVPNARAGASARGAGSASVIGADLTIVGNLNCKGEVQIDGKVEGDIHAQRIVIGEQAHTTGNLVAESIEVRGNAQGSIRGNTVTFQSTSRVEADVFHKSLAIEQGAFFEGKSRRSDDPLSGPRPTSTVLQPSRT